MFADSFWPNFALFVLGQVTAGLYLATGRLMRGGVLMLLLLVLADVALVARFGYGADDVAVAALVVLQASALVETALFTYGRWHRRRTSVQERRRAQYRSALLAELRGQDAEAAATLKRLCRRDPWDVESTVALACVQRRLGRTGQAGALLARARRLDRAGRFTDVVALEAARVQADRASSRLLRSGAQAAAPAAPPSGGRAPAALTTPSSAASPGPR